MRKPRVRGIHFVRYPSETAGARNGGPGKSPCQFWAKRAGVSSFAAAYNLGSEQAQAEQELPSGARADVILPGQVRSDAFEGQPSPITLDDLGRQSGIYWEHGVLPSGVFAANPLRRTRKVAEIPACRQARGLEPPAQPCPPAKDAGGSAGRLEPAGHRVSTALRV